jgi:hypothetical protein
MKQRKQATQAARAIDPRSLARSTGGSNQPQPWILVVPGPMIVADPEPNPW